MDEIDNTHVKNESNLSDDDCEEMRFLVKQAKAQILSWKAHILRSIHQDSARIDVLESLNESSVLVIQDWAMKYLPRKYCESQTDWFGKRGISWHTKKYTEVQMLTFCHIFKACSQDSNAVLALMADVIQQLKFIMPSLTTVYYRQGNAGCYHCGHVIISSSKLGQKEGIVLKRLDFSDPQGGNGACDHKAATIKSHMRVFLNSGNDIETPEQMFKAMVSFGGVPSLNVTLCEPFSSVETPAFKIDGVSLSSNIEYSADGIRVWRAYGIGLGKVVLQQKSSGQVTGALPALVVAQVHRSNFSSIKGRTIASARPSGDEKESTSSRGEDASTSLFACPEDGCVRRFIRHSSVLRHLDSGKHQYTLEHEPYTTKLLSNMLNNWKDKEPLWYPSLVSLVNTPVHKVWISAGR